ncbi:MAG: hypothetical protein ACE5KX_05180 [Acidimicrobiia bacterium]
MPFNGDAGLGTVVVVLVEVVVVSGSPVVERVVDVAEVMEVVDVVVVSADVSVQAPVARANAISTTMTGDRVTAR